MMPGAGRGGAGRAAPPGGQLRTAALASVLVAASALLVAGLAAGPAGEGWPVPDAASPFVLSGHAFAQTPTQVLSLNASGKIAEASGRELDGARGIAIFEVSGTTYAAVAARDDHGVQIINLADPDNPSAQGSVSDSQFTGLRGATGIAIFEISGTSHAAVASVVDDALQLVSLSNPSSPSSEAALNNENHLELNGATGVATFEISGTPYAAVAAADDDGVQIASLAALNIVPATGRIRDNGDRLLNGATGVAIFEASGTTYAVIASFADDGIQIINVTTPSSPTAAGKIADTTGEDGLLLDGAAGVAIFEDDGTTYAAVASFGDSGVQIIDLSDPANPTAAGKIGDDDSRELDGATGIATFEISGTTYAAVAAATDDGVQIIDLSDPDNPTAAAKMEDTTGEDGLLLDGATAVAIFQSSGDTYAAVAARADDGVQIIRLTAADTTPPPATAPPEHAFVTTWTTDSAGQTVILPVSGSDMEISWGDGSTPEDASGTATHTYAEAGTYTVSVTGGLTRINLGSSSSNDANDGRLASIQQWGNASWTTMSGAFWGASNMIYNATDAPDLSRVTDMAGMFSSASSFDGDISSWNVLGVTTMASMFSGASEFNQPLDSWDVSEVTDMARMFFNAAAFNQSLNSWDVSAVTDMSAMFREATAFNQPLNSWTVSEVTDMAGMFNTASSFNQDISSWDVAEVTTMNSMFSGASSFNQPLNSWDVSSVTNMFSMFYNAAAFNQPLNSWDVSSATNMLVMFSGAASFNQNLGPWYITPGSAEFDASGGSLDVTEMTAQNSQLNGHNPTYGIGSGGNSTLFEFDGDTLAFKYTPTENGPYTVNVTASDGTVFEDGNNWRTVEVEVSGVPPTAAAGPDQTVSGGDTVTLDGSGSRRRRHLLVGPGLRDRRHPVRLDRRAAHLYGPGRPRHPGLCPYGDRLGVPDGYRHRHRDSVGSQPRGA